MITGPILANFSHRVALKVVDKHNSKLLLEHAGAETLQGKGDMLFRGIGGSLQRVQAGYASNAEITDRMSKLAGPQVFDSDLQKALDEVAGEP